MISNSTTLRTFTKGLSTLKGNSQVYIHPLKNNAVSLSFFRDPAKPPIGEVYVHDIDPSQLASPLPTAISKTFKSNPEFLSKLQSTIADTIQDDMTFLMESEAFTDQNMPIYDLRKPPEFQRIPEIEDTFGFVAVTSKGKIKKGSYQPNDFYRIITADGSVVKLSEDLLENLRGKSD